MRDVIFTAMKILIAVFWVMTSCGDVIWYQRFGGPCCLYLQEKNGVWIKIHFLVVWVMTPCSDVVGKCFGGTHWNGGSSVLRNYYPAMSTEG